MPLAGFEPMIQVFEQSKNIRARESAASGTGSFYMWYIVMIIHFVSDEFTFPLRKKKEISFFLQNNENAKVRGSIPSSVPIVRV
jgi:hypothetical protein